MKKAVLILGFLCLFKSAGFAQDMSESVAGSGSYYSYFGLGSPNSLAGAQEQSMGINGVSFNNYETPGLGNPAFWGHGAYSRGSVNFNLGQFRAESNAASSKNNLFDIGTLHLVFPIIKWKLGLSAAAYSVTNSNYKSEILQTIYPGAQDTLSFSSLREGRGGVSKFELGMGFAISDYVSIGYAPSLAVIRNDNTELLRFFQSGYASNFVNTKITDSEMSHRFGLLIGKPSFLKRGDLLQFGASLTLPVRFKAKSEKQTTVDISGVPTQVELEEIENAKVSLPLQISSGFTYFAGTYLNFSIEGSYEQWSNVKYDLDTTQENNFKNRVNVGAGAQYHPYRSGSEAFFSRFKYSAGIAYDTGYLQIADNNISTLWLSAGLGVVSPMMSRSSFDLSIRYGLTGTKDMNLIQEKVWLIGLSVNLTELMFNRQKLN